MAEFVPADGEEFERGDHQSYAGDGPQTKQHDRIDDYLSIRLENTEVEKGKEGLEWVTHCKEHSQLEGKREIQRKAKGRRKDACISHLVMCRHDGAVTFFWSDGWWEPRV